uniref:Col_cuticle_N domain-containing protein n=1 Tax=Heterorhabditis bacteriophora TaxID=37862 RepID=A0A1I7WQQ8_HETBA
MASLAAVPVVALAAGAALAMTVPVLALKELLEKRSRRNFKKHLGRRRSCRVNFGDLDMSSLRGEIKNLDGNTPIVGGAKQSPPPAYEDLFRPPPPYHTK